MNEKMKQIRNAFDDEDEKEWNKSFGITDTDYKDISDSYDDSVEHRTIVNEYLKTK